MFTYPIGFNRSGGASVVWNDINTAVYSSKSFDTTPQTTGSTRGIYFKENGTKVYAFSYTTGKIFQYSLSTPWDITTASSDSKSLTVSTQDTLVIDFYIKPDGTSLYAMGYINDVIYQYNLSTPWDISTATYSNKSFAIGNGETSASSLYFKPDGTKVYAAGMGNDTVYQYSLSTPWDISTASYDNKSFSIIIQTSDVVGLFFKPDDGKKMFVLSFTGSAIYQYNLSTPWDISTASYVSNLFNVGTQATQSQGFYIRPDGSNFYIANRADNIIYQYSL